MKVFTTPFIILFSPLFLSAQFGETNSITSSAAGAVDVMMEDMDNDGDLDIICANQNASQIMWYENLGSGNFSAAKTISNDVFSIKSIYSSDLNGDGNVDILSAYDNKISLFYNLNGGIFQPAINLTSSASGAADVIAIDLDNDGDNDVIWGSNWGKQIAWHENLGGGSFSAPNVITTLSSGITSIYSEDIDSDGLMDIISGTSNGEISWFENLGSGNFSSQQIVSSLNSQISSVHSEDIDGDGDMDLLSTSMGDNKIAWYENNGGGNFAAQQIISNTLSDPTSINAYDIDNDGDKDIFSTISGNDEIVWFENIGGGNFNPHVTLSNLTKGSRKIVAGDLDGDSDLDLASASYSDDKIAWYENIGGNTFGYQQPLSIAASNVASIHSSDLDGDGKKDILSASSKDNKVAWYRNLGDGLFSDQIIVDSVATGAKEIHAADLNNDGTNDIIYASDNDTIGWYLNNGDGTFNSRSIIATGVNSSRALVPADIDNDGDFDLVATLTPEEKVVWYENIGGGVFSSENIIFDQIGLPWTSIVADLDADGDLDIISSFWVEDKVIWLSNNGSGNFGSQQILDNNADGIKSVFAIDIDNDLDIDIIAALSNPKQIVLYENINNTSFASKQIIYNPSLGEIIDVSSADINMDGLNDVILSSGNIGWIKNLGGNMFDTLDHFSFTPVNNATTIAIDLDGDDDFDIITCSDLRGEIESIENQFNFKTQISGKVYYDANQNSIIDSNEIGLGSVNILSNPISLYSYTDLNGNYFTNFSDTIGNYIVAPYNISHWSLVSDSSTYSIGIDSTFTVIDSLDFGFYPDSITNDISIDLTNDLLRCSSVLNYWINYSNIGTTNPSGVILLTLADSLQYINSSFLPDSITGQNIYWSYDSLQFFNNNNINITVSTPTFLNMGTTLTSSLSVSVIDDFEQIDTVFMDSVSPILTCAYDPNDKSVFPGYGPLGIISTEVESLEYIIRFQNTGTDTAFNIVIEDQLDTKLNWETITPISSSHSFSVGLTQAGKLSFIFNNIMLPDSNINELESHGFIKYQIDISPGLPMGTSIYNEANIFFDANPPIQTNQTLSTIYNCEGITIESLSSIAICENTSILGSVSDPLSVTEFSWNLDSIFTSASSSFYWLSDTSGTFNLTVTKNNDYCIRDTTIQVEVYPSYFLNSIDTTMICQNDSILIYGQYQSEAGLYVDSLQTIFNGCDSIIGVQLELQNIPTHYDSIQFCSGDSIYLHGQYQSITGIYLDTLQSNLGCDSIFQTHVSNYISIISDTDSVSICENDSILLFGVYRDSAGTYFDSLQTSYGCDSIVTLNLTVHTMNTSVIFTDSTISSTVNNAIYQWLDCNDNYSTLNGNTLQTFYPITGGLYSLEIEENGCVDTSECVLISFTDISSIETSSQVSIYPNPTDRVINIDLKHSGNVSISIVNVTGQMIYFENEINKFPFQIELNEPSGLYFVKVQNQDTENIFKLLIK